MATKALSPWELLMMSEFGSKFPKAGETEEPGWGWPLTPMKPDEMQNYFSTGETPEAAPFPGGLELPTGLADRFYNEVSRPTNLGRTAASADDPLWKSLLGDALNLTKEGFLEPMVDVSKLLTGIPLYNSLTQDMGQLFPNDYPEYGPDSAGGPPRPPLPSADQGTEVDTMSPFQQMLDAITGGGGGGGVTRQQIGSMSAPIIDYTEGLPGAPDYTSPDYTRARENLELARPEAISIDPGEVLASVLGGAALAAAKGQSLGETLALAGGGAALAYSDIKERERALKTHHDLAMQQWYSAKSQLEMGIAGDEAQAANAQMDSAYQHMMMVYQATIENKKQMQPNVQVSGNNIVMTKYNPNTNEVETSITRISEPSSGGAPSINEMVTLMDLSREDDYRNKGIPDFLFDMYRVYENSPEMVSTALLSAAITTGRLPDGVVRMEMEALGLDVDQLMGVDSMAQFTGTDSSPEEMGKAKFLQMIQIIGSDPNLESALLSAFNARYEARMQ